MTTPTPSKNEKDGNDDAKLIVSTLSLRSPILTLPSPSGTTTASSPRLEIEDGNNELPTPTFHGLPFEISDYILEFLGPQKSHPIAKCSKHDNEIFQHHANLQVEKVNETFVRPFDFGDEDLSTTAKYYLIVAALSRFDDDMNELVQALESHEEREENADAERALALVDRASDLLLQNAPRHKQCEALDLLWKTFLEALGFDYECAFEVSAFDVPPNREVFESPRLLNFYRTLSRQTEVTPQYMYASDVFALMFYYCTVCVGSIDQVTLDLENLMLFRQGHSEFREHRPTVWGVDIQYVLHLRHVGHVEESLEAALELLRQVGLHHSCQRNALLVLVDTLLVTEERLRNTQDLNEILGHLGRFRRELREDTTMDQSEKTDMLRWAQNAIETVSYYVICDID